MSLLTITWLVACAPGGDGSGICEGGSHVRGTLEMHHLPLGQADATLVVTPEGRGVIVDVGETEYPADAGARLVGATVERVLGCRRIEALVLTHFHLDHAGIPGRGGAWHLVVEQGFEVGATWHRDRRAIRGRTGATLRAWDRWLDGEGASRMRARVAQVGDVLLREGALTIAVVAADGNGVLRMGDHGGAAVPPEEDDFSLALLLSYGAFDYVHLGDLSGAYVRGDGYAYHDIERTVAPRVGDVDVLRVAHHGSTHSSGDAFLAHTAPEVAVISAGAGNPYGHPHAAAVTRIGRHARVFSTLEGQPVVIRTRDGRTFDVGGTTFRAASVARADEDGDGWFAEADPDDRDRRVVPAPRGGCDVAYETCR